MIAHHGFFSAVKTGITMDSARSCLWTLRFRRHHHSLYLAQQQLRIQELSVEVPKIGPGLQHHLSTGVKIRPLPCVVEVATKSGMHHVLDLLVDHEKSQRHSDQICLG